MKEVSTTFILKVAGACNINCSYCYMFNGGDTTFRLRPRVMDKHVAAATLERIYRYASSRNLKKVFFSLHGGEPLLVGKDWMRWFLDQTHCLAPAGLEVDLALQTNGTLLDREWISLLSSHDVGIGISMDGPAEWHDRYRVNFSGHGTYALVRRAIDLLLTQADADPGWGVLVVTNPEHPGVAIYRHLLEIGVRRIDFLWPDYHHDSPPPWPAGTLGRYYIDLFDAWYGAGDPGVEIRFFLSAMRMLVGGTPQVDALGPQALAEVVVETDGSLEPLDVLRICGNGMTRLGLNVLTHEMEDLHGTRLFQLCLHNQEILPQQCLSCPVYGICGGGYMPHRWGRGRGFANPSVFCTDLLSVLTHIDNRIQPELAAARSLSLPQ